MVDRLLRAGMQLVVALSIAACSAIVKPAGDPLKQAVAADDGTVVFIDRDSKASQWIIGLQTRDELALYRSATLDRGHWEKLRGEKLGVSFWTGPRSV